MTLTVRSSSLTGATTAARALTHAEMDANWAHVIESSNQNFTPSGIALASPASRSVEDKLSELGVSVNDHSGVAGDGSTNSGVGIQAVLDAAGDLATGGSVGVEVGLPAGEFITNQQLVIPNKVKLVGKGRRSSVIKAGASFPVDTAMVRLGDGTDVVFDCRVESLALNCNSVSGSKGIYSTDAQEGAGARDVLIQNHMAYGIDFDDSGASNFNDHYLIDNVEIYASASATGTIGFRYKGLKNGGQLRRITCSAASGAVDQTAGVKVEGTGAAGAHVTILGLNCERVTDGLLLDTNGGATANNVSLNTSGTNVVNINSTQPVFLSGLQRGAGTNIVNNQTLSQTLTDSRLAWYIATGSGEGYQVLSAAGNTSTDGNVVGSDQPAWKLKSTATSGSGSRAVIDLVDGNGDGWRIWNLPDGTSDPLSLRPITAWVVGSAALTLLDDGTVICHNQALATDATGGFLYVPSCAGTPTGTPTTQAGRVPLVVDTTNNRLYFYSGGSWRNAGP
jgi:hypothetical protein